MKGRGWAFALALLLIGKGTGILPQSREIEERKLISVIAVDGKEEISVTAVTGVRTSEDEEAEVLAGTGDSLAKACRELRGGSARQAYLGQVEQLLLGEEGEIRETLDFVLADRELRMDTLFYIVRGRAGEALAASAERVAGETGGKDPRGRTVGEILPRLTEGEYTLVPALGMGEDGAVIPAGWAVVGPSGLVGYLEEDAAQGAALLAGIGTRRVVTLSGGVVELRRTRCWARDGKVHCELTGRGVQGRPGEAELAAWGERCLRAALAFGWDCWGLDREQGALRPGEWKRIKGSSPAKLDVEVIGKLVDS